MTRLAAAAVLSMVMAGSAQAAPIVHPDLTVFETSMVYDGTDFVASCGECGFSWTTPAGGFGGFGFGTFLFDWDGDTNTGSFTLNDFGAEDVVLAGDVTSFAANATSTAFLAFADLTVSNLGFGTNVRLDFSTFFGDNQFGGEQALRVPINATGNVDITPAQVPEPGLLSLVALGAAGYLSRRRSHRHRA